MEQEGTRQDKEKKGRFPGLQHISPPVGFFLVLVGLLLVFLGLLLRQARVESVAVHDAEVNTLRAEMDGAHARNELDLSKARRAYRLAGDKLRHELEDLVFARFVEAPMENYDELRSDRDLLAAMISVENNSPRIQELVGELLEFQPDLQSVLRRLAAEDESGLLNPSEVGNPKNIIAVGGVEDWYKLQKLLARYKDYLEAELNKNTERQLETKFADAIDTVAQVIKHMTQADAEMKGLQSAWKEIGARRDEKVKSFEQQVRELDDEIHGKQLELLEQMKGMKELEAARRGKAEERAAAEEKNEAGLLAAATERNLSKAAMTGWGRFFSWLQFLGIIVMLVGTCGLILSSRGFVQGACAVFFFVALAFTFYTEYSYMTQFRFGPHPAYQADTGAVAEDIESSYWAPLDTPGTHWSNWQISRAWQGEGPGVGMTPGIQQEWNVLQTAEPDLIHWGGVKEWERARRFEGGAPDTPAPLEMER